MKIIITTGHFLRSYSLLLAFFLSGIGLLQAQNRLITGLVTYEGEPLSGVNVNLKSTTLNTLTNDKGIYKIGARSGNILVFSHIGYQTQEIVVKVNDTINIEFEPEYTELNEVQLSSGYYSLKERARTGNVTKVNQKEFENQIVNSPLEALQGRVAGLEVQSVSGVPGQAPKVLIRGQTSIRGELYSQPLYIIDGVPINNEGLPSSNGIYNSSAGLDPLATLNPSLIESIEVLKDADATAIYGSRGANGVIIINTKRGKAGKTKFEMQAETGVSWVGKFMKLMNTEQYLEMRREAFSNDGVEPTEANAPDLLLWDQNKYTDWQKELIGHHAEFQKYQGTLSGGNQQTSFLLSGGFQKETTVFPGDFGFQSNNLLANINHRSLDNKLSLNTSINYGYQKSNLFDTGLFMANGIRLSPNAPDLFDEDGNINWELDEHGNPTFSNPMAGMLNPNNIKMNSLQWSGGISYELLHDLYLKMNIGINDLETKNQQIRLKKNINPLNQASGRSSTDIRNIQRRHILVEPQINYLLRKGRHKIETLIGGTFQKNKQTEFSANAIGYTSESQVGNLALADDITIYVDGLTEYRYAAIFGRIGYSYANKYYLNFTGRRDGSSRFGKKNRFGNFGAIGGAWNFYKEKFVLDNLEWLNFGKLRASYGITGSDDIGDYQYLDLYKQIALYPGSLSSGGIIPQKLNNPYYQWEKNKKIEIALDLGLLEDKLFLSANWYRERSGNQLINIQLPSTTGFTGIEGNLDAVVQNSGWEFLMEASPFQKNEFSWKSSLNLTIPKNKLIAFPDLESSSYANTYEIGKPLGIMKLYKYIGVDSETGLYSFEDVNGDGVLNSEDKVITKDLSRKFYGGLGNSFQYKNWNLNVFFEFVKQNGLSHLTEYGIPGGQAGTQRNAPIDYLDRWQSLGDKASHQKFMQGYDMNAYYYRQSDQNIIDASFIRLKSISLNYDFSNQVLENIGMEQAQIYLQAQNLFTWTRYKGYDAQTPGELRVPILSSIHVGLKLTI